MKQIRVDDAISNLELNIRWIEDNPAHQFAGHGNVVMAMRDALELLKERLPIAPKPIHASERWYSCGNCDCSITKDEDIYCPRCGRPIKWS